MRRAVIAAASTVPLLLATVAVMDTAADATPPATATISQGTINYQGATIAVPRGWPVYDLAKDPTRCVRLDRHAVYLGTPGANQRCPSHLIGRTETLLVQPYQGGAVPAEPDTVQATQGKALITASYGVDGAAAARRLLPGAARTPPRPAAGTAATPSNVTPSASNLVQGPAFDTCAAPSKSAMHTWSTSSPYEAVGIYIGGLNRACAYGNLSESWVGTVRSFGYHFIPTYVGRQAPCSNVGALITPGSKAQEQGLDAARDALSNMRKLGFGKGSPVYLDIEHYGGDISCRQAVLSFVNAWVVRLHMSGYRAGLYTSSWGSIVKHHNDGFHNPDVIWIGRWNGEATVFGDPVVPDNFWASHQRIHQYKGPHLVRYGGVTLDIDTDWVDSRLG